MEDYITENHPSIGVSMSTVSTSYDSRGIANQAAYTATNNSSAVVSKKGSKKKKSKKPASDQILDRIIQDTDELDEMLFLSQKLREDNSKRQQLAFDSFEVELDNIGDLSNIEEYFAMKDKATAKTIDHNISRLMMKPSSTSYNVVRTKHNLMDDPFETIDEEKRVNTTKSGRNKRDVLTAEKSKRDHVNEPPAPSFDEKVEIRMKIMDLLDDNRSKEENLNDKLTMARKEDPTQCEGIVEEIYQTQKENVDRLAQLINEYRPSSCNRAWGNDPESILLFQRIRQILVPEDSAIALKETSTSASSRRRR